MANYRRPGVYVEEIATFPPSVATVETALPAFIGYTVTRPGAANEPVRIGSLLEFQELFGRGLPPVVTAVLLDDNRQFVRATMTQAFHLYEALQLFYANGGGDCFIVSIGALLSGAPTPQPGDFTDGIDALLTWDEPTILLFPDAVSLNDVPFHQIYGVHDHALAHCQTMKDRVAILDLVPDTDGEQDTQEFRTRTSTVGLSYGAAYTPWLVVSLPKSFDAPHLIGLGTIYSGGDAGTNVSLENMLPAAEQPLVPAVTTAENAVAAAPDPPALATALADLEIAKTNLYQQSATYRSILRGLNDTRLPTPPSGAVAGVYAFVDSTRGVWKAPANVSISLADALTQVFTKTELGDLNVDAVSGKSINAIRQFTGRGIMVYGARTLAGNDGEYKYVSVRRLMNMLEESIQKATTAFVFEPNDANTWVRVQAMIENFLTLLWRDGALQGAKAEHAFRVAVGLGKTMTAQDVIDGRMIVEIAVAPVRPAEFIVLRFMQHLPTS